MRRIQHQRLPFGPTMKTDRHPSILSAERRIRRARGGDWLKTWGSRSAAPRAEVRRAA